jgi:DNA mismatch repair ATPase MutS
MKDFLAYACFSDFWDKSVPETPFGRDVHEKQELFFDIAQLEKLYDQTGALLALMQEANDEPAQLSLISHHLKQLPRFSGQVKDAFDEIEIFQVKKFLRNYRALMEQLPNSIRKIFGFEYASQPLEKLLNQGGQSLETFYLANEYSPELAKIRSEILNIDTHIQSLDDNKNKEICDRYAFDFKGRPFLLVPKDCLGDLTSASRLLAIEPYDDKLFSVRPLRCAKTLKLAEERQKLAQKERICEEEVLKSIANEIRAELPNLLKYRDVATAFDLAWARARMAHELGLVRPCLHVKNEIHISKGRFAPCEAICAKHGILYTPLDASFESGATVIFGPNMGGKTVVLQTTAFLQLAAQTGLFVPAEEFKTRIFQCFHYIGENHHGQIFRGLSGFGVEMEQLMRAWQNINADTKGTMLLMDEFARTTSSGEAEAILAAVLEAISQKTNTVALCSTHSHRLPRLPGISFLRMAGLEQKNIPTQLGTDKIKEIAQHMTYSLMADDGKQTSDAIAIAQMLGMDKGLLERAEEFLNGQ